MEKQELLPGPIGGFGQSKLTAIYRGAQATSLQGSSSNYSRDIGATPRCALWIASTITLVGLCVGNAAAQPTACIGELVSRCSVVHTTSEGTFVPGRNSLAIAPDGRFLIYLGVGDSTTGLYVRSVADTVSRPLAGTAGASRPVFSADGDWIAFFSGRELRKIRRDGGQSVVLARGVSALPIAWATDNTIILPRSGLKGGRRGLSRIPAEGGEPATLTLSDSVNNKRHWNPLLLSDSVSILFIEQGPGGLEDDYLSIGSATTGNFTVLDVHAATPLGYANGRVVFTAGGKIMAVPVDLKRRSVTGNAVTILDGLTNDYDVSLAWNGTLVYANSPARLVWVSEKGEQSKVMENSASNYQWPRLSPDETRIAVTISGAGATSWDIGIYNTITQSLSPLGATGGERPEWNSNGKDLMYMLPGIARTRAGLWSKSVDGSGPPERLNTTAIRDSGWAAEGVISPDRMSILFRVVTSVGESDLYYSTQGEKTVVKQWLATKANEVTPRFSPDGRFVAYASDESGFYEVYVRPFLGSGAPRRISDGGGAEPVWSRDGRRIYYRKGGWMMVAEVSTSPDITVLSRKSLFAWPGSPDLGHASYDVAADGKLLMVQRSSEVVVITNWVDRLPASATAEK